MLNCGRNGVEAFFKPLVMRSFLFCWKVRRGSAFDLCHLRSVRRQDRDAMREHVLSVLRKSHEFLVERARFGSPR